MVLYNNVIIGRFVQGISRRHTPKSVTLALPASGGNTLRSRNRGPAPIFPDAGFGERSVPKVT
jgi:hypothetical protein